MSSQIRPAVPSDYEAIAALISSQNPEPTTLDDILRGERLRNPADPCIRLVAVDEAETLLATGSATRGAGNRPGEFSARVRVWKQHESKGIGAALYSRLEAFVRENGGTSMESTVRDDDLRSVAWTERRDYVQKQHLFESSLSLPGWDPAPFLGAVEAVQATGIRFTTLAQEGELESLLRPYYEFSADLVQDIPGMEDRPRYPYAEWLKWVKEDPEFDPNLILLAADGDRWVAVAQLLKLTHGYYNGFTGVDRAYRGRGLSLALKVVSLMRAKELGAPFVRTNNDSTNQPMLATNRRLGYTPLPGFYVIRKRL